jgi:hypothetical protein
MKKKNISILIALSTVLVVSVAASALPGVLADRETELTLSGVQIAASADDGLAEVKARMRTDLPESVETTLTFQPNGVVVINAHSEEEAEFLRQIFVIPQYIYDEMTQMDWTWLEQYQFVMQIKGIPLDMESAWAQYKLGESVDEMTAQWETAEAERTALINDYVLDNISAETYMEQYPLYLEAKT